MGIWRCWAKLISIKWPSAPESSRVWQLWTLAAHCILTGTRVVDQDFSMDRPSDSNLSSTVGLGLLLDSQLGSDPKRRNTSKVPLLSDGPSPPGKAELFPPAWVHNQMGDWPYYRNWQWTIYAVEIPTPSGSYSGLADHVAVDMHQHEGLIRWVHQDQWVIPL